MVDKIREKLESKFLGKMGITSVEKENDKIKIIHNKYIPEEKRQLIKKIAKDTEIMYVWK